MSQSVLHWPLDSAGSTQNHMIVVDDNNKEHENQPSNGLIPHHKHQWAPPTTFYTPPDSEERVPAESSWYRGFFTNDWFLQRPDFTNSCGYDDTLIIIIKFECVSEWWYHPGRITALGDATRLRVHSCIEWNQKLQAQYSKHLFFSYWTWWHWGFRMTLYIIFQWMFGEDITAKSLLIADLKHLVNTFKPRQLFFGPRLGCCSSDNEQESFTDSVGFQSS